MFNGKKGLSLLISFILIFILTICFGYLIVKTGLNDTFISFDDIKIPELLDINFCYDGENILINLPTQNNLYSSLYLSLNIVSLNNSILGYDYLLNLSDTSNYYTLNLNEYLDENQLYFIKFKHLFLDNVNGELLFNIPENADYLQKAPLSICE